MFGGIAARLAQLKKSNDEKVELRGHCLSYCCEFGKHCPRKKI